MAIARVQATSGNGAGYVNAISKAFASNVTAGSLLVAFIAHASASSLASVTDSKGQTWTKAEDGAAGDVKGEIWYCKNAGAGATTVTATLPASTWEDMCIIIQEFSGLDTAAPLDKTAETAATTWATSHNSGNTATTSQSNELICGFSVGDESTPTWAAGSGFSGLVSQGGSDVYIAAAAEYKTVSVTGAYNATFGSTDSIKTYTAVVTFKDATPGSDPSSSFRPRVIIT